MCVLFQPMLRLLNTSETSNIAKNVFHPGLQQGLRKSLETFDINTVNAFMSGLEPLLKSDKPKVPNVFDFTDKLKT